MGQQRAAGASTSSWVPPMMSVSRHAQHSQCQVLPTTHIRHCDMLEALWCLKELSQSQFTNFTHGPEYDLLNTKILCSPWRPILLCPFLSYVLHCEMKPLVGLEQHLPESRSKYSAQKSHSWTVKGGCRQTTRKEAAHKNVVSVAHTWRQLCWVWWGLCGHWNHPGPAAFCCGLTLLISHTPHVAFYPNTAFVHAVLGTVKGSSDYWTLFSRNRSHVSEFQH